LPPVTPPTFQITAVVLAFTTVALNCALVPVCKALFDGATLTTIAGGKAMVREAVSDLVVSAFDAAVTLTVDEAGGVEGAVYKPTVEIVP
jgi:hypothetical protein